MSDEVQESTQSPTPESQIEPKPSSSVWSRAMIGVIPLLGIGAFLLFGFQHCGSIPENAALDQPAAEEDEAVSDTANQPSGINTSSAGGGKQIAGGGKAVSDSTMTTETLVNGGEN